MARKLEIGGAGTTQYTILPDDNGLLQRYGMQVIHVYPGKRGEFALPAKALEHQAFWAAVEAALLERLDKG